MAMKYTTLGDVAEELWKMKAEGMTRTSVEYAMGQVYWEESEESNG